MDLTFEQIVKILLGLLVVLAVGFFVYMFRDQIFGFMNNLPS